MKNLILKNKILIVISSIVLMFIYVFSWKPETGPMNAIGIPMRLLFIACIIDLTQGQYKLHLPI